MNSVSDSNTDFFRVIHSFFPEIANHRKLLKRHICTLCNRQSYSKGKQWHCYFLALQQACSWVAECITLYVTQKAAGKCLKNFLQPPSICCSSIRLIKTMGHKVLTHCLNWENYFKLSHKVYYKKKKKVVCSFTYWSLFSCIFVSFLIAMALKQNH